MTEQDPQTQYNDSAADAVAIVALLLLAVATTVYWLWGLSH